MKLSELPIEAWQIVQPDQDSDFLAALIASYGEPLRIYGADYEGVTALVFVWMGPTFSTVCCEKGGEPASFEDAWPEIAEWHSNIVRKLVWASEEKDDAGR